MADNKLNQKQPAVLFSGGAEIVSVSISESLTSNDVPLIIFALGVKSIIRDLPQVIAYKELSWPPNGSGDHTALKEVIETLKAINPTWPLPTFATEDGGLRFLIENKEILSKFLVIRGARQLLMHGLDKAELFEYLQNQNLHHLIAPTVILETPEDIEKAYKQFGANFIIKPGLKPLSMKINLGDFQKKIISIKDSESTEETLARLKKVWPMSERWVAQQRLAAPKEGEALWWGGRFKNGKFVSLTAFERWNQPRVGGTGCWVETDNIPELSKKAKEILASLDFNGVAELPFLKNQEGEWRLLELNPRSWLQIGLPERAGIPLVYLDYCDMLTHSLEKAIQSSMQASNKSWVNVERLLLAATSGEYGPRIPALFRALNIIHQSDCKVVYDTFLPKVRFRWSLRVLKKLK